jgi:hypothetical protein
MPANQLTKPWRITASKVVEELFSVTPQGSWDDLLDLRGMLVHGKDWPEVLDCFLTCRRKMEEDHYLPFYRLRKILVSHLQLENDRVSLAVLLRNRDFSFRRWQQRAQRLGKPARVLEEIA